MMTLSFAAILGSLLVLAWSADRFVDSAAALARLLGVAPLIVGMIIVGLGTSAPELIVSTLASLEKNSGIALGNAYGSNIANIAVILGVTAIMTPITVSSRIIIRELPILIVVTLLSLSLFIDGECSRWDAAILLAAFSALLFWMVRESYRHRGDPLEQDHEQNRSSQPQSTVGRSVVWIVIGLVAMIISSRFLVWGAVNIAQQLGVSDLIIGLTVIALGTSLPEFASSIAAARKHQNDLVLGNIIGSNLFNALAVVGVSGLIYPFTVSREFLYRDGVMVTAVTLLLFGVCWPFLYQFRHRIACGTLSNDPNGNAVHGTIQRWEGWILVISYVAYILWIIWKPMETA